MSDQGELFDAAGLDDGRKAWQRPARELARLTDPATSRESALEVPGSRVARAMMRTLLREYVAGSLTSEQAALRARLDPEKSSKRTSDLIRLGYLEPTGETRIGTSGRAQRVLAITAKGWAALSDGAAGID